MAEHEITTAEDGTGPQTLTPDTVDTVVIAAGAKDLRGGGPRDEVRIIAGGEADLYVTFDGQTPLTNGTRGYRIPGGAVAVLDENIPAGEGKTVKLISEEAATYSVEVH